jgi:predicted transcriptional regulator
MAQPVAPPIGKNRSRFEIMSKMLEIGIQGSKSTRLMYGGNLSYTQFRLYLNFLLNNGFLSPYKDEGGVLYKTTEKGLKFLRAVKEIDNLLTEGKGLEPEIAW